MRVKPFRRIAALHLLYSNPSSRLSVHFSYNIIEPTMDTGKTKTGLHFTPRLKFLEVKISIESHSHLRLE
jgi:hypothetical protein